MATIIQVENAAQVELVRELFIEYNKAINVDLCFQDFDKELADLPGIYAQPEGRLFLAYNNDLLAGCAGLTAKSNQICEMKRLYVRSEFRGKGFGRELVVASIDSAREIGYTRIRLDTLSNMTEALSLYKSLGFTRIKPYRFNPMPDSVFLELKL